jgi:hypothetical protein
MTSFFDSCLWKDLILPMSHSERAVTHAVVALAAMHEDLQSRGAPLSREDLANRRQQFALGQYGRSLAALNERRYSQDPKLRDVILTCCMLFVAIDVLRGHYDPALLHLKNGLAIIEEERQLGTEKAGVVANRTAVEQTLLANMARLETQSAFFGLNPLTSSNFSCSSDSSDGTYFRTLEQAQRALDKLLACSSRLFVAVYQFPAKDRLVRLHPKLAQTQISLMARFREFGQRLGISMTHSLRPAALKEKRGLDLILLHQVTFLVLVETVLCGDDQSQYNKHLSSFQQMMALSNKISQSFKDENDSGIRPTLLLDAGIIPPLFVICWKCRDFKLRHQALIALEEWPHREGLWDSRLLAIFSRQIIRLEEEALAQSGDPNALSKIRGHSIQVAEDQSHAVLKYETHEPGKEVVKQRRVVSLDEGE